MIRLGLPHATKLQSSDKDKRWAWAVNTADRRVLDQFPSLARSAPVADQEATPYRLFSGIAALEDRSIAFVGHIQTKTNFRVAECQALWAVAYLDQQLTLPSRTEMIDDIALLNALSRRRYPKSGQMGNSYHSDSVGYTDKLLRGVSMSLSWKKGRLAKLRDSSPTSDLQQIRAEYIRLRRGR